MGHGGRSRAGKKPRRNLSHRQRRLRDLELGDWRRDYNIATTRDFLESRARAHESRRLFFHLREREEIRWREMLRDAPTEYSPHWIDVIQDPKLREYVRQTYLQLREEQDDGTGITVLRDLLLRRLMWCARIAYRIEGVMEDYWIKDLIAEKDDNPWRARLLTAERHYTHLTKVMLDLAFHLHRTGPKPKRQAQTSAGRVGAGTVTIPVDE